MIDKNSDYYTFEKAIEIIIERDEGICQNCGDIIATPLVFRLKGGEGDYNPDNFILVCYSCKKNFDNFLVKIHK